MKDRFYLACFRDNVGANVAWHSDGGGYVTDVRKAQVYTREEAQRAWNGLREFDRPISADHVDALLVWKVDCQYLPNEPRTLPKDEPLLAYRTGQWSGNDVYWLSDTGNSLDVHQAKALTIDEALRLGEHYALLPRKKVMAVARPTFEYKDYNARTMVQGAGIRIPSHVRKERNRRPSSKVLMNCPDCGRFNWQMNPHDFESCSNQQCRSNSIWG